MKALTICQPYAELIASGQKRVENRTWRTDYQGPLAIHAGASRKFLKLDREGARDEQCGIHVADMTLGAIVAVARLVDCVPIAKARWDAVAGAARHPWLLRHPHTEGPFCWVLENVWRLDDPIPCKGKLGLWTVPEQLTERLPAV